MSAAAVVVALCDWCGVASVAAEGDRCGACTDETCERCVHCAVALGDDARDTGDGLVCEGCYEVRPVCGSCAGSGEGMRDGTTCGACHGSGERSSYADEDASEAYWDDLAEWRWEARRDAERDGGAW